MSSLITPVSIMVDQLKEFPSNTSGRVCRLQQVEYEEYTYTHLLYVCAFGFIGVFTMSYFSWMIRRFLSGHCPDRKYSCIGVYKRNVITLKQTAMWYLLTVATGVIDRAFEFSAFHHQQQFSREAWFLLWTLKGFLIYEGFYFLLPFALTLPQDWTEKPFFMTKFDHLEPRVPNISRTEKDKEAAGSSGLCEIVTVDNVTIVQVDESEPEKEEGDRSSGSVINKSLYLEKNLTKKVREGEGGGGGQIIWISHC